MHPLAVSQIPIGTVSQTQDQHPSATRPLAYSSGTHHHARDPAPLCVPLLPQIDIVQLHPHHILFGGLEMFALFRVGLDLCDPGLFDLRVGRAEELGERGSEGKAGVVGEGEVDVVAREREELR